jgi:hypothetical protein
MLLSGAIFHADDYLSYLFAPSNAVVMAALSAGR